LEPQQLATKVAQLESRVATLEDEGKIVKGEVKQILTEIRSVILVRDNPFENEGMSAGRGSPVTNIVSHTQQEAQPRPQPKPAPIAAEEPEEEPEPEPEPEPEKPAPKPEPPKEPVMLRPQPAPAAPAPPPQPEPEQPQWSLLTIAGLSAWAEEAMRRLGSLRLEILLDLCEAAGHLTPEARAALARVTELDIAEPAQTPSTNETVVILRQLDALVNDDQDYGEPRLQRRF
jgi:outer membrane biosynthesis protein TonB